MATTEEFENGGSTSYSFAIEYPTGKESSIKVKVDGTPLTYTTNPTNNTQYKVVNNSAAAEEGPATKKEREYYREIADNIFREAMRNSEPSVPGWKIWSAYTAVRLFGRWAINSSAPRKK